MVELFFDLVFVFAVTQTRSSPRSSAGPRLTCWRYADAPSQRSSLRGAPSRDPRLGRFRFTPHANVQFAQLLFVDFTWRLRQ